MGRCLEFGPVITDSCAHPMRANSDSCSCAECGAVCKGMFEGCAGVWARGARPMMMVAAQAVPSVNGHEVPHGLGPYVPDRPPAGDQVTQDPPHAGEAISGRADVLRWFETAFEALHEEAQALRAAVVAEHSKTVEAIQARPSESEPRPTAEALLGTARDAVTAAVTERMEGIERSVAVTVAVAVAERMAAVQESLFVAVESLRFELHDALTAHGGAIAALQQSVDQVLAAAAEDSAAAPRRHTAQLRALNWSLTRQLQPICDAVNESAAELATVVYRLEDLTETVAESLTLPPGDAGVPHAEQETEPAALPRRQTPTVSPAWAALASPAPEPPTGEDTTRSRGRGRRVSLRDGTVADQAPATDPW